MQLDYSRKEKAFWNILKITYILSFPILISSYFFPYYTVGGEDYYRYSSIEIFPLFYIIVTTIAMVGNWFIFYKVHIDDFTRSDLYSVLLWNLFVLTERLWLPYLNDAISDTPNISPGLFLFHMALFIQMIGIFLYVLKKRNDKVLGLC